MTELDKKAKALSDSVIAFASTLKDKDIDPETVERVIKRVEGLTADKISKVTEVNFNQDAKHIIRGLKFLAKSVGKLIHFLPEGINPDDTPDHEAIETVEIIGDILSCIHDDVNSMREAFYSTLIFAFNDSEQFERLAEKMINDVTQEAKKKGVN